MVIVNVPQDGRVGRKAQEPLGLVPDGLGWAVGGTMIWHLRLDGYDEKI